MSHFLYEDVSITPKIYCSHRTKFSFNYKIGDEPVASEKQQIEIDMTIENDGNISIFEAKNRFRKDFAVYQIYLPFLYYTENKKIKNLAIKDINCCYLLRDKKAASSTIRIYQYTFDEPYDMTSIRLLKSAEYAIYQNN